MTISISLIMLFMKNCINKLSLKIIQTNSSKLSTKCILNIIGYRQL